MRLLLRRLVAPFARLTAHGMTACHHCGIPWKYVTPYYVEYRPRRYIFVACTDCWPLLDYDDAMHYTRGVVFGLGYGWRRNDPWDRESAVDALAAVALAVKVRHALRQFTGELPP